MKVREEFVKFFSEYKEAYTRKHLEFVVTCGDRPKDPVGSPHKKPDNAIDITLRWYQDYAPIDAYNHLFAHMLNHWPYRAGIDNTIGNIHIHIDLGQGSKTGCPYFFKEDGGKFLYSIESEAQIA